MKKLKTYILPAIGFLAMCQACTGIISTPVTEGPSEGLVTVGFSIDNSETKTSYDPSTNKVSWTDGDKMYVWAKDSQDNTVLNGTMFDLFGSVDSKAYFTAKLQKAMTAGMYDYIALYPSPVSQGVNAATYIVDSLQNGDVVENDILITNIVNARELKASSKIEDYMGLDLHARHLLHMFRIFIPEQYAQEAGESCRVFGIEAPQTIAGPIVIDDVFHPADIFINKDAAVSSKKIQATLPQAIPAGEHARIMAYPFQSMEGETLRCYIGTINGFWYSPEINLNSREFKGGHITTIAWAPGEYVDKRQFSIKMTKNHVGEPIRKLRLTAPDGWTWKDTQNNVVEIPGTSADTILCNKVETLKYLINQDIFDAGKADILVELISDHVKSKVTVTLDNLVEYESSASVEAPFLLFEDFSSLVADFSDGHDDVTGSVEGDAGNNFNTSFMNGWSGGRVGGKAGKCIRIAGRMEIGLYVAGNYWARVDSAPISEIISPVQVTISFDYGADRGGSLTFGQKFQVGYVQGTGVRNSGDSEIKSSKEYKIDKSVTSGSYDNTPSHVDYTLTMPVGATNRITWRNLPVYERKFAGNSTTWLYIDNIVVKVKK